MPFEFGNITGGTLYFGDDEKAVQWDAIPDFEPPDMEAQNTQAMTFECDFCVNDLLDTEKIFGIRKLKKVKPVRHRLLKRLKDKYGWFRTYNFTLWPEENGQWRMQINGY